MAANNLNKAALVEAIAGGAELSKAQAERALKSCLDAISTTLKKGGGVTLIGFGSFSVQRRKARKGKNPRTGEAIKIPARKVPKFSPGKGLRDTVAGVKAASAAPKKGKKAPAKKTRKK